MKIEHYTWIVLTLDLWARYMEARFGHPLMLVGGALRDKHPRDVDLVIVIPDDEFRGRYGQTPEQWHSDPGPGLRWINDMAKFNSMLARGHRINADFKVQPQTEGKKYRGRKRVIIGGNNALR